MAYQELIKHFERIRSYMREFYVYGFRSRDQYGEKSARSYDNERRRIESWLGGYLSFHQDPSGKRVFLSVDSRVIPRNPLYKAFKAKSFTNTDILLHFYLLDLLADGNLCSVRELIDGMQDHYLSRFPGAVSPDESTVRKKLKEYERLGLLRSEKHGQELRYRRTDDTPFPLESWTDALAFFSEEDPLGVIGSFLMDRQEEPSDLFRFKHHYILHALDSDVLCELLLAMEAHRTVELAVRNVHSSREVRRTVCPLKIYISTQSGRQYLLGHAYMGGQLVFVRLDAIRTVKAGAVEPQYETYLAAQQALDGHLWGVSGNTRRTLDHLEMTIRYAPWEEYIPQRLQREKRHGSVQILDEQTCRFTADVYDAMELLPWLRTFIGRIVELRCSDPAVVERFQQDLERMAALYGGDARAVQ